MKECGELSAMTSLTRTMLLWPAECLGLVVPLLCTQEESWAEAVTASPSGSMMLTALLDLKLALQNVVIRSLGSLTVIILKMWAYHATVSGCAGIALAL